MNTAQLNIYPKTGKELTQFPEENTLNVTTSHT